MNLLGLVFSLLLILSYGFFACWEKQASSTRLRGTYLGHQKANRKILNSYESELYETLRHKKKECEPKPAAPESGKPPKEKQPPAPINEECAKLNLYPLIQKGIQKGREENPFLYDTAAKLIAVFYQSLYGAKPGFENKFLDALLAAAQIALKNEPLFALEKLSFPNEELQLLYYKMLKGTKTQDPGYPSLLDYIKIEPGEEKICLFHAHPNLIAILFGPKAAPKIYQEIHKEKAPPITFESVERICYESHLIALDPNLNSLILFGQASHRQNLKKTLVEQDLETQVSLRKNVFLKQSS